jgi:hypothetical protein
MVARARAFDNKPLPAASAANFFIAGFGKSNGTLDMLSTPPTR